MASESVANRAVSNGIPPPDLKLEYPDDAETITRNIMTITETAPNPRTKFIFLAMIKKLHEFVNETHITTEEWMTCLQFLTRTGQTCTPLRQEFILLSDILGVSALVDALNNPRVGNSTESSVLGPFFTEDAPDLDMGDSIASEGKGEYLYVEGRILTTDGKPIPHAVIETWETDEFGFYDTQYKERDVPDCRGRLRSNDKGEYGYRAVVPVAYPIPGDGPVGDLLTHLGRHNMRPNHLHVMIEAPGFQKLTTALYPENDPYMFSDAVLGVKKSLVVKYEDVDNEAEARRRGFPSGSKFKLLKFDFVLVTEKESKAAQEEHAKQVTQATGTAIGIPKEEIQRI